MADNANTRGGRGVKRGGFDRHCCLILLLSIAACLIVAFVLIRIFVRIGGPIFTIEDYSIRANKSHNFKDTTFFCDVKLENKNTYMGVYYDTIKLTLYRSLYSTNWPVGSGNYPGSYSVTPVGSNTYPGFYQGHSKNTHLSAEVRRFVWNGSDEVFQVELETEYRLKIARWKTKRYHFSFGPFVRVNRFGLKVMDDGTLLTSTSPEERGGFHARLMIILCCSLVLII